MLILRPLWRIRAFSDQTLLESFSVTEDPSDVFMCLTICTTWIIFGLSFGISFQHLCLAVVCLGGGLTALTHHVTTVSAARRSRTAGGKNSLSICRARLTKPDCDRTIPSIPVIASLQSKHGASVNKTTKFIYKVNNNLQTFRIDMFLSHAAPSFTLGYFAPLPSVSLKR